MSAGQQAAPLTPPGARRAFPWICVGAIAFVTLRFLHPWSENLAAFLIASLVAWLACAVLSTTGIRARTVFWGAVLWRLLFVSLPPSLSDDIYRYVWEGQIQWAGWNPFAVAPNAQALVALRNSIWPLINNPGASAIYPPMTQIVFKCMAAFFAVSGFKALFCLVDLLIVVVLLRGVRVRGTSPGLVAWYAWNPLVVTEVAGSGHYEPLALLPMILGIHWLHKHGTLAWIALSVSIGFKYAGALLLMPFRRHRALPWIALAAASLLWLAALAPYLDAGRSLFDSLLLYADKWRYNDLLFGVLARMTGSLTTAKIAAAILLLGATFVVSRRHLALEWQCLLLLTCLLWLSPTIHPWYLLWVAVLLPWAPSRAVLAWTGGIVFSYLFLFPLGDAAAIDKGSLWVRALQVVPFGMGAWMDGRARRKKVAASLVDKVDKGEAWVGSKAPVAGRVVLMMPALNEAESLPLVLADLQKLQQQTGLLDEIIVVDNGSSDATRDIAHNAGATVLEEPQRGYGSACLRALSYLRQSPPAILVFMDADRSDDAQEIASLLRPIQEEGYDMVIGSRALGEHEPGALLPQARFGNWLATSLIRWNYGFAYTDLGPFRAVRFAALERLHMRDRDFGWTVEMQVRALQENLRICEVPVRYRRRVGQSKISGTLGGSVRAGIKILSTLWRLRRSS